MSHANSLPSGRAQRPLASRPFVHDNARSVARAIALAATACATVGAAWPAVGAAQELRAEEALSLAASQNPSLEAAARDAAAARYGREAERDAVRPTVTASVGASRNERFSATSQGPALNEDHGGDARVGVSHTTAIGTRVSAEVTSSMSWQTVNLTAGTTTAVTIGPVYRGQLALTATQPLLRGAGRDATRASLERARALERQAGHRYDQAASELARDVLTAYWELWYAQRALAVTGHRDFSECKHVEARAVGNQCQHALGGDAFTAAQQGQLFDFLACRQQIALDTLAQ